ncbi:hypothetical protein C4573_01630 [Candidatus Woesearchaeota archaeon]|nr:MAG: hypothetical protein C4573_01630 [Candidatus Woesearchaeota archaeon]
MEKKKVVILGAGPAGLCAGHALLPDYEVTLLEKSSHVAGLASCFRYKGKTIPKYYHHIFQHDIITRRYFDELAKVKAMRWERIKVGICVDKKTYSFADPLSLVTFDYLSLWGRVRYGLFGAYVLFFMNPVRIEDHLDAETWLLKHAGSEVTKKIFYHLYSRNKFNIPLNQISAKQFAYRLKAKEAIGIFGFPKKGLHTLFEGLENHIIKKGGKVKKRIALQKVDLKRKEIIYQNEKKQQFVLSYDILINTIPVPEFLKIQEGLPEAYAKKIGKVRYCPVVSVVFASENYLSKHYWLNLLNERAQIIMQHSLLNDDFGHKISWVSRYGGSEEDIDLPDKEIIKAYLKDVKKFFPKTKVYWARVFKEKYAEPIYDKTYSKKKPNHETPIKDFYFAGIAVTYPKIRNINTALESGEMVATIIKKKDGL